MKPKTFWIIFAIAAILRVAWINVAPLWYDENFTLILARLPFNEMITATAGDVHPPLWYIIEWAWMQIPNLPAWAIRVPALIFSVGTIPLFAAILDTLGISPKVQTAALIMMAIMPFQLWYAQEGRMYAMLEFFVLLTLFAALTQNYLLIFIGSLALLYTQNYGPFYMVAIALVVSFRERRDNLNWTISAMTSAGVLWLPWLIVVGRQMSEINGRYWIMDASFGGVLITVYKLFMTAAVPDAFLVASYAVTFAALLIGLYALIRSRHPAGWTVLIMAFVPLLIAWIASIVWQPVLLFRPLIGISPFLYLVVCWTCDFSTAKEQGPVTSKLFPSLALLPILASSLFGYYGNIAAMKGEGSESSLGDALAYVEANWQTGDIIFVTDDGPWVNLAPYTDKPIYRITPCGPVLGELSTATRSALGMVIADLDDIPHRRAWVFAPFSPLHPSCYRDIVKDITSADPVMVVDKNDWLFSAVWLVEE